jgi:hypothetical protein
MKTAKTKQRHPWMRLFTLETAKNDDARKARLETIRGIMDYRNTLKFRGR